MRLPRAFFIRSRQSMCMITGMKHGQRLYKVFSNILKYSIIVKGGIQHWGTVHRYHLSWRLWQPNLTECPRNRGKISAKRSCGGWCGLGNWTYSHQEIVDPVDGYLNMRVQGPVSGLTYGAEAWVQTTYNFNDGKSYIINFTWEPNFANYDYHVNGYYIQVTDGYIFPGYSMSWGFLQYPESVDLLWDETNVHGTRGWFFDNKPSPGKLNWSLRILP